MTLLDELDQADWTADEMDLWQSLITLRGDAAAELIVLAAAAWLLAERADGPEGLRDLVGQFGDVATMWSGVSLRHSLRVVGGTDA